MPKIIAFFDALWARVSSWLLAGQTLVRQAIGDEPCQQHKYFYEVIQERRCVSADSTLGVSAGRIRASFQAHAEWLTGEVMLVVMSC